MALGTRNRRRRQHSPEVWTALSADARDHFRQVGGADCACSACWLLRANGLTAPPSEAAAG